MAKINSMLARGLLKAWKLCNPEQVKRFERNARIESQLANGAVKIELRDGEPVTVEKQPII